MSSDPSSSKGSREPFYTPHISFPTISATAFLIGATTACIISLRRGRKAALRAQQLRANRRIPTAATQSNGSALEVAKRGPLALFSELNAAAFNRAPSSQSPSTSNGQLPTALSAKARGKQPLREDHTASHTKPQGAGMDMWTSFDAPEGAPPPSVLMRRRQPQPQARAQPKPTAEAAAKPQGAGMDMWTAFDAPTGAPPPSVLIRRRHQPPQPTTPALSQQHVEEQGPGWADEDDEDEYGVRAPAEGEGEGDGSIWSSPVGLAVGAFTLATALVGATAFVGVQVAKSLIGFETTDEFVQRMTDLVPSRSSTSDALRLPQPSASLTPAQTDHDDELYAAWEAQSSEQEEAAPNIGGEEGQQQGSLTEALARLDGARSPAEWWEILRDQLDAEREEDVRARAERVSARRV
ncbi:hypothetical protein A4X09_0g6341 [Tilletia walkeri]|uniref:Transmembrane protein n=1 Tax=Tilletia walkeri TaxID=117179 RepID=A0A8X7N4J9_9BASI|nr:hypothetical protein A4X09_0g6341 [Tilletia walkeri]